MPKLSDNRVPSYRLHKQSGQAVVTLDGRDICLGLHGSAQSKAEYNRLLAEWLANGRSLPPSPQAITIVEVADAFLKHAQVYYRNADGMPTGEVGNYYQALRPLLKLYATTTVADLGPLCLKAVRLKMIEAGWCRRHINDGRGALPPNRRSLCWNGAGNTAFTLTNCGISRQLGCERNSAWKPRK
jgi:hypothetical protein